MFKRRYLSCVLYFRVLFELSSSFTVIRNGILVNLLIASNMTFDVFFAPHFFLPTAAQLGHRVAVLDYVEPSLKGTYRQTHL